MLFFSLPNKNCQVVLPTHLQLMHHPASCTNEYTLQAAITLSLPRKKVLGVSQNYTQNEVQKDHPKRVS